MRRRGEIRQAISKAAQELAAEAGSATWLDLAVRAGCASPPSLRRLARRTVDNMARAHELERIGHERRANANRWMTLYAPPAERAAAIQAAPLETVIRGWCKR